MSKRTFLGGIAVLCVALGLLAPAGASADEEGPVVTITSGPAALTSATSATIEFTVDQDATAECRLDSTESAGWAPCQSPQELTGLGQGPHRFEVRATDSEEVTGEAATHEWTVDSVAPEVTLTSQPPAVTGSDSASVEFTTEAGADTECRLDSDEEAAWAACDSPVEFTALTEGAHRFEVRARDEAGNTSEPVASTWRVDLTAPSVTVSSGPAAYTSATSASIEFTVDDQDATVECRLDSSDALDWAPCASPYTTDELDDGEHRLEIRATDAVGNASDLAQYWTVDTQAPATTIDSAPAEESNSIKAELTFSSDEPDVVTECRLDPSEESAWEPCTSPVDLDDLADGPHRFEVRATDQAGNIGPAASHDWTVTTVKPATTIISGPADPTAQDSASFEFESDNPGASFECRLDPAEDSEWSDCDSPASYTDLTHGEHRFEVRATEPDQGTGPLASYTWSVDLVTPTVELTSTPATISGTADPVFSFEASEPGTTAECRLDPADDDAVWAACASPSAYTGLAEGEHHFEVRVTDAVGHVSEPATYDWTIETTPPDVTIHSGPESPTTEISASFTFSSSNQNAYFECRLDGSAWGTCLSGIAYGQLDDGEHEFEVRAVGHGAGPGPVESRTWVIDTVVPTVSITAGPRHVTNETTADFSFTASKPGFTFRCQLDSDPADACSSPAGYTGLDAGEHQLRVELVDGDDQTVDSANWDWKVLTDRPVATITSGPAAATSAETAVFEFRSDVEGSTFECRLDGGSWSTCNSPAGFSELADGPHTFEVRAGLPGSAPGVVAEREWTVDTVAPDLRITGGPAGTSNSDAARFTIESDDPDADTECSLDGAAWSACGAEPQFTGLEDGAHVLRVRASDAVGNTGFARHDWSVDRTAPAITVSSGPEANTSARDARFAFTADDPEAAFECQLDDAAWKPCTSAYEVAGLAIGSHRFALRASDRVGNVSAPVVREWQITAVSPRGLAPSIKLYGKARLNADGATRIGVVNCPEGRCRVSGSKRVRIQIKGRKLFAGVHAPRTFYRAQHIAVTLITTAKIRRVIGKVGRAKVKVTLTVFSDNGKQHKVTRTIKLSGK